MRKIAIFVVAAALLALNFTVAYGKNCKQGKPCGNSCISVNKTCHYGGGSSSYGGGSSYRSYTPSVNTNSTYSPTNTDRQKESTNEKQPEPKKIVDYEIIKDRVIAKRLPDSDDVTGVLRKGDIVQIYEESGSWVQISTSQNKKWIERSTISERKKK